MVNDDDLRTELGPMVDRYGLKTVFRILHEMEAENTGPRGGRETRSQSRKSRPSGGQTKRRRSAVDYVEAMEVPPERAAVVRRAAEEFERGAFLPTLGDVRIFCEAYGIEEPRSKARAAGIPRIFKFLVTMAAENVERMLDDQVFSGPAKLAPIADAIRDKAKKASPHIRRDYRTLPLTAANPIRDKSDHDKEQD